MEFLIFFVLSLLFGFAINFVICKVKLIINMIGPTICMIVKIFFTIGKVVINMDDEQLFVTSKIFIIESLFFLSVYHELSKLCLKCKKNSNILFLNRKSCYDEYGGRMTKQNKWIRSIVAFFIFWGSFSFKWIPIVLLRLNAKNISGTMSVILSTFSSVLLMFIYFFIYRKDLKEDFKKLKKNTFEKLDIGFKYWILGIIIMLISNYIILFLFKSGGANNEIGVQKMVKAFPFLMLIDAGLISPFNEEIAFRKTFKDIIKNKWVFAFISFLLFGGAHVILGATVWTDYLYIVPYGALGACFALSYYETDSIFIPMFSHMMHNTILMIISIIAL